MQGSLECDNAESHWRIRDGQDGIEIQIDSQVETSWK